MALHAYWVHGNTFQAEFPEDLERTERRGWGTHFYGKPGTYNWFHTSITTPVYLNNVRPQLRKVMWLYKTTVPQERERGMYEQPESPRELLKRSVKITEIHIYDGGTLIRKLGKGGVGVGDYSNRIDFGINCLVPIPEDEPPLIVYFGLGISVRVEFPSDVRDDRSILFTAAGADFETE